MEKKLPGYNLKGEIMTLKYIENFTCLEHSFVCFIWLE